MNISSLDDKEKENSHFQHGIINQNTINTYLSFIINKVSNVGASYWPAVFLKDIGRWKSNCFPWRIGVSVRLIMNCRTTIPEIHSRFVFCLFFECRLLLSIYIVKPASFYCPSISSKLFPFLYLFYILLVHRSVCAYFVCRRTFGHSFQY